MKIGVHFMNFAIPGGTPEIGPALAATARAADEGGVSTMTLMDHYFQMEQVGRSQDPMLEGYTSLGFIAGVTSRLDLGLLVTGVTYRYPGLLAKIVTTLDVLSGGRALLGLGAAWYERESRALGVPFPSTAERFERLEETLQICRQMWSENDGSFDGKHYQLAETICSPQPLHRPRVLIGGMGERKTLRLVAQYGDACNLFAVGHEAVAHKLQVLDGHCAELGRDPGEIQRTIIGAGNPLDDPDAFLADMERYRALGIDQVWVSTPIDDGLDRAAWVSRLCDQVVPKLAEL